jgi:ketosteroid isomerase-like protein
MIGSGGIDMPKTFAALVAAIFLSGAAFANVAPPPLESPERAGEAAFAFLENFNAGNLEGVASTYSDSGDFVWVENGAISYSDKASAVAGMKERFAASPGARLEASDGWKIIPAGTGGSEIIAPITLYVKDAKTGEEKAAVSGVMTLVLRLENGEWRIVSGHTSTAISMQ